ncbi:MAG TPA: DMT family transporter [Vicinamibacterales bacterium]|jgi:drug/metabolite transporter (DMT)-like permease|nr:DMT family transporter [Vicinamibacterales bacterium]
MANTERNAARLQAVAAAVLFSTGGAGIKVEAFSAAQVSCVRSGIAAVALLLWLRGRVRWTPGTLAAGLVYAATLSLFVGATKLTTAANAIFLQSTAPLYLLLLAPLVLRERVHLRDVLYLAAIATGLVFCFAGTPGATATASNPALGTWLGAASGLAWALTLVALRIIGRGDANSTDAVAPVVAGNVLAVLVALPFALPFPRATAGEWLTLVYLGVFQIGLAYICLAGAIRHLPALEISLLLLLEPVLNPVWTWIIRGEEPGRWTMIGGAVIVGATIIKLLVDARRPEPGVAGAPAA